MFSVVEQIIQRIRTVKSVFKLCLWLLLCVMIGLLPLMYNGSKNNNRLENHVLDSGSLLYPGGEGGVRVQSAAAGATRLQRPE